MGRVHRVSSSLLGPAAPSFRALSRRLKFTVRRHKLCKDSLSLVPVTVPTRDLSFFESVGLGISEGGREIPANAAGTPAASSEAPAASSCGAPAGSPSAAGPSASRERPPSRRSLKSSPSESHIFKSFALVMAGAETSQWTAADPAKAPGAARLSLSKTCPSSSRHTSSAHIFGGYPSEPG